MAQGDCLLLSLRLGGEALGVDRCVKPRSVKAPCIRLDLTRAEDQALILAEVRRADVVWLAPPWTYRCVRPKARSAS